MFGKKFLLNEQTMHIVEEIGRHMPGGFFIYKAETPDELLYANQAVLNIFGCENLEEFKELTGFTFKGIVHPDDYESISASITDQIAKSNDELDRVEYRIIRKDGQVRWVDDYGHYTETDSYGGIYYVFISDITEKHDAEQNRHEQKDRMISELENETIEKNKALSEALEAAEQANKAKTAFLSSMSHEIRTPMNAIIGLDSLALRNENLAPETRDYLEKM